MIAQREAQEQVLISQHRIWDKSPCGQELIALAGSIMLKFL